MKKIAVVIISFFAFNAYAQQSSVTTPDPDWGENQHIQERAAYWHAIEISGPDTNVAEARIRGYNQFVSIPRPKGMMIQSVNAWQQVGSSQGVPDRNGNSFNGTVSGRPTSIAFDPISSQIYYIGTSGGGLWKTTDGGTNWTSLSDSWTSYAMGGVAVDYSDRNTIYAATGDLYDRSGDGLYKSTDGGLNWVHYAVSGTIGTQCNQVVIDPQVHTTIYVTSSGGLSKSTDAGVTWKKILSIGGTTHMVIDPMNGQNIYVGGSGAIRKSTDGGNSWTGDLASNINGKFTVTLGISKSDPSKIYASIGSTGGGSVGVARSNDHGSTWSLVWQGANYMSQQAFYDNACAVSPSNINNVVVGGLDIWGSSNGSFFNQRTNWQSESSSGNFSHADIHVLAYSPYGGLFALTDGGIFYSDNNGITWQQGKNNSLATLLFVGGDAAPDFSFVLGGAQDNGINRISTTTPGVVFSQTRGGDGGHCFISQSDGQSAYSTYIYASLQKSGDGGLSWDPGPNNNFNIIPNDCPLLHENVPFYMNYDVSESDGAVVVIAGGTNVYYSSNGGNTIDAITTTNSIPGGPRAVYVAAADPNVVYVSSGNSSVYVNNDAGDLNTATWVKTTTKMSGVVSCFVADPLNAGNAWASISGYGTHHFAATTDFGKTWAFPATNLPDLDASSITRDPNGNLFLGTTFGVLYSKDNGVTWATLRDGIPLCQITKLRVRGTNNQWLLATTYGRGMYKIDISNLPPVAVNAVAASAPTSGDVPVITSISPNPVQVNAHVKIAFRLTVESEATLILFDELGREVKTLLKQFRPQGDQTADVDISSLSSGVYYAVLTSNGHAVTQKFAITK